MCGWVRGSGAAAALLVVDLREIDEVVAGCGESRGRRAREVSKLR